MPESYEIDPQREIVICRAWGRLTDEEVRGHYRRILADPAFRPEYRQLADLTDVIDFTVDSRTIEEAARMHVFTPGTRRAFIAPRGVAFGLARMFSIYSATAGQLMEVFADARHAEEWLGLSGVHP
ncbi:MAG: hypothetical protein JWL61_4762 [Gemmatimonadetes bacterium]|jgi:hypothetical protein|nr:hypothetical protein [Gemmatimonadota bacterium]